MSIIKFENPEFTSTHRQPRSWLKTLKSILIWHALRTHVLEQIDWNTSRETKKAVPHEKPIPWWTYSCIQFVDQMIPTSSTILEIGVGNSSLYWMDRGNCLVTLETSLDWINVLRLNHRFDKSLHKIIHIVDESIGSMSNILEEKMFDVVINDGTGDRARIGEYLAAKVKQNGILIWDDSERVPDRIAIENMKLNGWDALEFYGLGPINAYAWKTTILYRGNLLPKSISN
jgi:hypothetical protein